MTEAQRIAEGLSEAQRRTLDTFSGAWEDYVNVNIDAAQSLCGKGLAEYEFDDRQNPLNDPEPPRHYYHLTSLGLEVRDTLLRARASSTEKNNA
jgi:hypothetical protein